jgi:hypothetical protein
MCSGLRTRSAKRRVGASLEVKSMSGKGATRSVSFGGSLTCATITRVVGCNVDCRVGGWNSNNTVECLSLKNNTWLYVYRESVCY